MKLPKQIRRKQNLLEIGEKHFLIKIRPKATAEYLSDTSPKS